ncbi:Spherulation-specific family 4 [Triangularia verruculosa]|uniref:Spherulation-specific family 4 n=1 Tax=Triangularia verruculosa TaxID=2587418 RepID=A0AAN7AVM5_9PEZI|nr:Spherulation-specific family 4 [Triangularia verruculosa]
MGSKMTKLFSRSSSSSSSSVSASSTRAFILIPLYIYPDPGAWEPLTTAARRFPHIEFIVVVNPHNGPGEGDKPDENYVTVLQQLRDLENVKLIGYVYCSYGKRPTKEMEEDVKRYQVWECEKRGCGVTIRGIFFDEAPASSDYVSYMAAASKSVRGILPSEATVVYNPGIFPDYKYYDSADFVIPFENVGREWWSEYVRDNVKKMPRELKERSIVVAHSCEGEEKERILADVRHERWGGHFLTVEGGYERWDGDWAGYVGGSDEDWDEEERGCCH